MVPQEDSKCFKGKIYTQTLRVHISWWLVVLFRFAFQKMEGGQVGISK